MAIIPSLPLKIINLLEQNGAKDVLIVGGFVRDSLLGISSKDIDIEVYGLSYSQIRHILAPHFHVDLVGQAFGVIKVGNSVDVALPRRESKSGLGHKGFDVEAVHDLSPKEAFGRRDFTINAIGMRKDGSYCDPYDGIGDLKRKILRATSSAFKDDPLRVLRGMQFAARLGYKMDSQTIQYCREVYDEFPTLSEERIYDEWKKWAQRGIYPERGLDVLYETGWINAFPELASLLNANHPLRGKLWLHTKAVCREATDAIRNFEPGLGDDERTILMFAALSHDFSKSTTASLDETGLLRSTGRPEACASLARRFLERMKAPKRIVNAVESLVNSHTETSDFCLEPSPKAIRRLAQRLAPANIKLWTLLCQSDALGCGVEQRRLVSSRETTNIESQTQEEGSERHTLRLQSEQWRENARRLDLLESPPQPIIQGRDLLALGLKPGPQVGELLKELFEAQIDGIFSTHEEGLDCLKKKLNF